VEAKRGQGSGGLPRVLGDGGLTARSDPAGRRQASNEPGQAVDAPPLLIDREEGGRVDAGRQERAEPPDLGGVQDIAGEEDDPARTDLLEEFAQLVRLLGPVQADEEKLSDLRLQVHEASPPVAAMSGPRRSGL